MDFSISEEQAMLADSVSRFISNDYDFEQRQQIAASDEGYSKAHWQTFAELGFTAVPFSESDGGLDGGPVETMLMMEQFGRGLVVEPYLANIVLAGGVLQRLATPGQKEKWLAPLIGGDLQAALCFAEPQARYDIANIQTAAQKDGDNYILTGSKNFVLNGDRADFLIVPARTGGAQTDRNGVSLFVVDAATDGVICRGYPTVDGQRAAEIQFDNVAVSADNLLGTAGGGFETLADVIDDGTLAIAAEAVGIARVMHDKTVEYVKQRVQFGVPIGSFQALQHRLVDTLMACEQSQSLLLWAVMTDTAARNDAARRAISAIKYQVGTACIKVGREAVQLHGGMGVSWELDIAHYFKRLTAIDLTFGNADFHLDRYLALQ